MHAPSLLLVFLTGPGPPASRLWYRRGPKARPLMPEQRCNRELLVLAQHISRTRSPRSTKTLAKAT
ncbi:hypothetical protein [Streptomyces sp. Wb2n-11]|uniref:hypothetical protein n=1 Tax=Streptomyces sp. Wb2n-11 TaxID=1030533 RepID=UPI000A8CD864|nr:hypothetical protein [Streptomyces sp. Wb2n-11]